jgi:hypothetical protein
VTRRSTLRDLVCVGEALYLKDDTTRTIGLCCPEIHSGGDFLELLPPGSGQRGAEMRQYTMMLLIRFKDSIAQYAGSCPCPYNTDRAGRRCGRRSAYSRPGGASPICYSEDVTQEMVNNYRKKAKQ